MKFLNHLVWLLLLALIPLKAEELNLPESVIYDATDNMYLISNTGSGKILKMNENGDLQLLAQGLGAPRGMVLVEDTVFLTSNKSIIGIDKNTGQKILDLNLQSQVYLLNDICYDGSDKLYFSDMGGNAIFSLSISNREVSKLNLSSVITAPNGIMFDNGNLICVNFTEQAKVYSISLSDNTVSILKNTNYDNLDGIAKDENNNYLVSSWGGATGNLLKYKNDFSGSPEVVKSDINGPADFIYRADIKTAILPLFNDNMIAFVLLGAPPKVVLELPINDDTLDEYKVKFEWEKIAGASKYKFQLSKYEDFSDVLLSTEYKDNYSDLISLDTSTKYYWRVSAYNLGQWGESSDIWHFTTGKMIYIPPTLLQPKNQETGVGIEPTLIWSKSPAGIYEVELSENIEFSPSIFIAKNLLDTSVTVSEHLSPNSTYYWRVRTYSGIIASEWSPISVFSTYNTPPAVPELLYPANYNSNIIRLVTFEWTPVKNATSYKMMLSKNIDFPDSSTYNYEVQHTSTNIQKFKIPDTLRYSLQYWWKVRSVNSFGDGNWTETYTFYTIINDDTTNGINDSKGYFSVGPNPASDYLNINTSLDQSGIIYDIIDCNGVKIKSFDLNSNDVQSRIDIRDLSAGAYLINIIGNGKLLGTIKFIKM